MFQFINFKIFMISLFVGLFFVYLSTPPAKVIMVYPTPNNAETIKYQDKADNCHMFDSTKVNCPDDKSVIKNIPIQE